eukprot:5213982-Amphidinium_carterae.2
MSRIHPTSLAQLGHGAEEVESRRCRFQVKVRLLPAGATNVCCVYVDLVWLCERGFASACMYPNGVMVGVSERVVVVEVVVRSVVDEWIRVGRWPNETRRQG